MSRSVNAAKLKALDKRHARNVQQEFVSDVQYFDVGCNEWKNAGLLCEIKLLEKILKFKSSLKAGNELQSKQLIHHWWWYYYFEEEVLEGRL